MSSRRPALGRRGVLAAALSAASLPFAAAAPCDIYAAGKTPCIAAHSTTRALFDSFAGPLYEVTRASDGSTTSIRPASPGGVANASKQDQFCEKTTCLITVIYDQSGHGADLHQAPPGGFRGPEKNGFDNFASATGAPVQVKNAPAYGVFISPGTGYSNNNPVLPTGDEPQGMYAIFDGTHYNGVCCFDYGNAELNSHDTGNGHMEAIYFGDSTTWGSGAGSGPWIMADLENGLFAGQGTGKENANPPISHRFVTAIVKGRPNEWAIRGGNAAEGSLDTFYSGARPTVGGYNPMSKEGAIVLGIGGDNSNGAQGTFYEGVVTSGYPSDETENKVQADIVAAGYATASLTSGRAFTAGSSVSLKVTTPGYDTRYLAHAGTAVNTQVVTSSSDGALKKAASWTVRAGLAQRDCVSFESVDAAGSFLRHSQFVLLVAANDNSKAFREDATFCPQAGLSGTGSSIRSWNYPTRYIRHFTDRGFVASNGGVHEFDAALSFIDDVSFEVHDAFA